jgi:crossover junction endodeoxyribonuclease RuvC
LIYIGIDPGLSGGIALLTDKGGLTLFEMPIVSNGKRNIFDVTSLRVILQDFSAGHVHVFVEELIPFKGSKLSCFGMGYGLGLLHATIQSLGIPMTRELPQKWKKEFQLIGKGKDASRMRAAELFPEHAELFAKKKGEGRAEAALMAERLRRLLRGS